MRNVLKFVHDFSRFFSSCIRTLVSIWNLYLIYVNLKMKSVKKKCAKIVKCSTACNDVENSILVSLN